VLWSTRQLSPEQRNKLIVWEGDFAAEAQALGINNHMTCYLYLVDRHGLVRYLGTGPPEDDAERVELENLIKQLQ
jgi:hypothetical protein